MSQQNKQLRIEAINIAVDILRERQAKMQMSSEALARGEVPYKVPPEGCRAGWVDNGHGWCVLDT